MFLGQNVGGFHETRICKEEIFNLVLATNSRNFPSMKRKEDIRHLKVNMDIYPNQKNRKKP